METATATRKQKGGKAAANQCKLCGVATAALYCDECKAHKHRFISSATNWQIIERHTEQRSVETGMEQGVIRERDGKLVKDPDLLKIRFCPSMVPIPCGLEEYEFRQMGVCIVDDRTDDGQFALTLIEAQVDMAEQSADRDRCRRFPFEFEEQMVRSYVCMGNDRKRLRALNLQE